MRSDVACCARNCMNIFNAVLIAFSSVIDLRSLRQSMRQDAGLKLSLRRPASAEILPWNCGADLPPYNTLYTHRINSRRRDKSRLTARARLEKLACAKTTFCAGDTRASTKPSGLFSHWNYRNLISQSGTGSARARLFTRLKNKRRNKQQNIVIRGCLTFSYLMKSRGRLFWYLNGNKSFPAFSLSLRVRSTRDNFIGICRFAARVFNTRSQVCILIKLNFDVIKLQSKISRLSKLDAMIYVSAREKFA